MGQPRPLFLFIFGLFKQTSLQFLQQICEKCPSSIRCRDSNPRPLKRESLPFTTRPGLPPWAQTVMQLRKKESWRKLRGFFILIVLLTHQETEEKGPHQVFSPLANISFRKQSGFICEGPNGCWTVSEGSRTQLAQLRYWRMQQSSRNESS